MKQPSGEAQSEIGSVGPAIALSQAIPELAPSLEELFGVIGKETGDVAGVTRDAFGAKETLAGDILIDYARRQGLDAGYDRVGNFSAALPGQLEKACDIIVGSHIDSVPRGGNYDGLAGVIAGIGVLSGLQRTNMTLPGGILRVLGFRGEESPWFGTAYLGSKLFLGQLRHAEREKLRRFDSDGTLNEYLRELGVDIATAGETPVVPPDRLKAYLELHIEQAPLLEAIDRPVGVATAIRGNIRYPFARCLGAYAHSGAVPRHLRNDALIATAKLIASADDRWRELIKVGNNDDLVFTCGILQTDAAEHAMTKVPGEVMFTLNIGGTRNAVMEDMHAGIMTRAEELTHEHGVRFQFGTRVGTEGIALSERITDMIERAGRELGSSPNPMPTVGHDAAMFARTGVLSGVILVRNRNGSHNPHEQMEMSDFVEGLKILAASVMKVR